MGLEDLAARRLAGELRFQGLLSGEAASPLTDDESRFLTSALMRASRPVGPLPEDLLAAACVLVLSHRDLRPADVERVAHAGPVTLPGVVPALATHPNLSVEGAAELVMRFWHRHGHRHRCTWQPDAALLAALLDTPHPHLRVGAELLAVWEGDAPWRLDEALIRMADAPPAAVEILSTLARDLADSAPSPVRRWGGDGPDVSDLVTQALLLAGELPAT